MSLHTALKAIGVVVVGLLLLPAFLAMGPIGWIGIGTMFVVGVVQVLRKVDSPGGTDHGSPAYCPNCGTEIDVDAYESAESDEEQWDVEYCSSCGAPVAPGEEPDPGTGRRNCPDCGAPNDAGAEECEYCEAEL